MRVLVTNDDGIGSAGLTVLADAALAAGHEVAVVAPHHQYSGSSAALMSHEEDGQLVFVDGRPPGLDASVKAFGVKAAPGLIGFVASSGAFGFTPDIVLSGINIGANTGRAVLHSGTVGAALSAAAHGVRGMAVSIASAEPQHWPTARAVVDRSLEWLTDHDIGDRVLNVNIPDVPLEKLRGIRPATLASFGAVQARVKEEGVGFVNLTYAKVEPGEEPDTDHQLLSRGWATWTLVRAPVADQDDVDLPRIDLADLADEPVSVAAGTVMSTTPGEPNPPAGH
ncbi:5'/3'-nucleotidase SurE [Demequina sp. TTPB684]|uniref:5'/3'-nucleotidase SurE n=1 Tax=unclassified Demequina TaxID=2620311 RepID=UPI001CF513F8|nr:MULTISPECIES: 5'/3'-nucleotidase SurE [unclassified Demequina]MCB2412304.1 5'/3'-nucleotidase SurE [Demequina sp. TTPB684]UPU87584.1 5'/3'-nucleotidase SurE [Demequina sp. TMPB413]